MYKNPEFPGGISGEGFLYRASHFGKDFPVTTSQRIKVSKDKNDYLTKFFAGIFVKVYATPFYIYVFLVKATIL